MRKTNRSGNFFLCLLFNIILNLEWAIPGVILLVLHFVLGISVWFSIGAFALWIAVILFWMFIMGWAARCGSTPDPVKENKNPYSAKNN